MEGEFKNIFSFESTLCTVNYRQSIFLFVFINLYLFRIGEVSSRYPKAVIALTLAVIGLLCCGLLFLEITINPIKLWAAPNSRARIERRFFDANFRPFFRTEHIILRPIQPVRIIPTEPSYLPFMLTIARTLFFRLRKTPCP